MIESRKAENRGGHAAVPLKNGINERSYRRTAGKDHQGPEEQQRQNDGQQPKFFPHLQKAPQILKKIH
jgi:hypothetical protein